MLDVRSDFPIFMRDVVYLDSAASAQKPRVVIDRMQDVLTTQYANVHRGVYEFSAKCSVDFENARKTVAKFLNAKTDREIIFTRNATEAINLAAASWGQQLQAGDEIILTDMEHHANIVPWYFLTQKYGAVIKSVPVAADGALDLEAFKKLLSSKTKMVAVTQMSNALGTVNDIAQIVRLAKSAGAATLVDGTQAVVHLDVDVQKLGADFYAFTGHKLYGPTGIGVLYGREDLLNEMPPYQGGGEMIEHVAFDNITYKSAPHRFEAGTPAIVEAIGLATAIDYLSTFDKADIRAHETTLLHGAEDALRDMGGVTVYSRAADRASILSFTVDGVHPHDTATVFDEMKLCVRAGHHCAQPLMRVLGVPATVRASFAIYNNMQDVERLVAGIRKVQKIFGVAA